MPKKKAENLPRIEVLERMLKPFYKMHPPYIEGLEHIAVARPALYVGNHTTLGILDIPLFYMALHKEANIFLKALAHKIFFKLSPIRAIAESLGVFEGNRANCGELMKSGEHILVFPGGSREVCKRKNEKYQLIWRERLGFVRMAIAHGYAIVPFAAVGAEECYDIHLDAEDFLQTKIGKLLKLIALDQINVPPLVSGWGGTPLPRPERFYFKLMKPVQTAHLTGKEGDDTTCYKVRQKVKKAIEGGIEELLKLRENDPLRYPLRRLLSHKKSG